MPGCILLPILTMLAHVSGMLTVAAFVSQKLLRDSASMVIAKVTKDGVHSLEIAPLVTTCLSWMEQAGGLNWVRLESQVDTGAVKAKLRYTKDDLGKLVLHLSSEWVGSASAAAVAEACKALEALAQTLKMKVPPWSHIISNTAYNATLAKKQLLGNKELHVVAKLVDEVSSLMESVLAFSSADLTCDSRVVHAEGVLVMAQTAMSVVAAVNTIENFSSAEDGPKMAKCLLEDRKSGLPDILRAKLKGMLAD